MTVAPSDEGMTAFYARVTRDDDESLSIKNQVAEYREIAKKRGWKTLDFIEEGRQNKGDWSAKKRPKLFQLVEAVRAGQVCRVVSRDLDRLGRGHVLGLILEDLAEAGAELWEFSGQVEYRTAAGELAVAVQASVGRFEVRRTGERIRRNKRQWWQEGVYVGPASFGFSNRARVIRELVEGGMAIEEAQVEAKQRIPGARGLVVDEAEGAVVREIAELYLDGGKGGLQIAAALNERGVLKRGRYWSGQAIRKLLLDPKIAGLLNFDEDAYQNKKPTSVLPKHRQRLLEGKHPAIIEPDDWRSIMALMEQRAGQVAVSRIGARVYPLTGVLVDARGHRMKGRSSGSDKLAYYTCSERTRRGDNPATGGCDCPPVNAVRAEEAARAALGDILGSPKLVVAVYEAAKRKLADEAPGRKEALKGIDDEIRGWAREREGLFAAFRNPSLAQDQHKVISDRVAEVNAKILDLQALRAETERKVVAIQAPPLDEGQVRAFLNNLAKHLTGRPEALRSLLLRLREHHDLQITAFDRYRVKVALSVEPRDVTREGGVRVASGTVVPSIPLLLDAEAGAHIMTAEEWAAAEMLRGHRCACGCGGAIKVRPDMRAPTRGIPKFLPGHSKMDMTEFVENLNAEGFVTVAQAAAALGVSENTLRRAEGHGWITPQWRTWGERQPMRIYTKADLPKVRAAMVEAGFRFRDDEGVLTTAEMAAALGISETHLRHLQREGIIPSPARDTANRRKWRTADLPTLREVLASRRPAHP